MLDGLKRTYLENKFDIELETDHKDSHWDWRDTDILGVTSICGAVSLAKAC